MYRGLSRKSSAIVISQECNITTCLRNIAVTWQTKRVDWKCECVNNDNFAVLVSGGSGRLLSECVY